MLNFYSVKLNSFQMEIFNYVSQGLSSKEFNIVQPINYANLNLNELACFAKTNSLAKEEFLKRISPRIRTTVKKFCVNYKIGHFHDLFQFGLEASTKIVESYDSSKGPFINFFASSIKRVLYFQVIKYVREISYAKDNYGINTGSNESYLPSSLQVVDPNPTKVANYVDIYKYISKLPKLERKITVLFLKGFTVCEIAKYSHYSIGSISVKLKKILKRLASIVEDCDYNYVGSRM